jgi:hypothetical protein
MQATPSAALIFGFQCRRHCPLHWFSDFNAGDTVRCIGFPILMQTAVSAAFMPKI